MRVVDRLTPAVQRVRAPTIPSSGAFAASSSAVSNAGCRSAPAARRRTCRSAPAPGTRPATGRRHWPASRTGPPGRRPWYPQHGVDRVLAADRVDGDVDAAEQELLGAELGLSRNAPVDRRTPRNTSSGATTSLAPNARASSRCLACLATTVIRPAWVSSRRASVANRPTAPAPLTRTDCPGSTLARNAACTAHGQRLHEHRALVGQPVRYGVQLAAVRDHDACPSHRRCRCRSRSADRASRGRP